MAGLPLVVEILPDLGGVCRVHASLCLVVQPHRARYERLRSHAALLRLHDDHLAYLLPGHRHGGIRGVLLVQHQDLRIHQSRLGRREAVHRQRYYLLQFEAYVRLRSVEMELGWWVVRGKGV